MFNEQTRSNEVRKPINPPCEIGAIYKDGFLTPKRAHR